MRGDEEVYIDEALDLAEVDSLKGVPIFSPSGQRLGALEGTVINKRSGSISYVVLCRSGFLGLRRERRMLPPTALTPRTEQGGFTVDFDWKARVQMASSPPRPALPARLDPARSE
jgi:sporulation protein YlmC with PRC-barrel domain